MLPSSVRWLTAPSRHRCSDLRIPKESQLVQDIFNSATKIGSEFLMIYEPSEGVCVLSVAVKPLHSSRVDTFGCPRCRTSIGRPKYSVYRLLKFPDLFFWDFNIFQHLLENLTPSARIYSPRKSSLTREVPPNVQAVRLL